MDPERDRRPDRGPALAPRSPRTRAQSARKRFKAPRSLRVTRAGWCFLAIILGVGFAALNTGNNLLYLVLALMLSFLVLSGLLSETSLRGIRVERRLPREIFAGASNRVVLRITNEVTRVAAFAISLEDCLDAPHGEEEMPVDDPRRAGRAFALRVGAGEPVDRSYEFAPRRRGEHHFDHVRVSTRFPFGLFVKSLELELPATVLVYPEIQPAALRDDGRLGAETEEQSGDARRGDDVAGLREFVPGDALGRVHWRRSLRSGRLLVGEREGEAAGEVEVLVRVGGRAPREAIEDRIREAASEIVAHLDGGLRVGLRSPRIRIPPGAGAAHRRELLGYLARVDVDELRAEAAPDEAAARTARRGGVPG